MRARRALVGALVLLAAPPSAPAAGHPDRRVPPAVPEASLASPQRRVLEALGRWDLVAARAAIDRLPDPGAPRDTLLRAQVALHGGDYAEAERLLDALPAPLAADAAVADLRRVVAAALAMARGLEPRASEHFVLWHDPQRDAVLVEPALETLERSREAAGTWLGFFPEGKVRVEIAADAGDFGRAANLTREQIEAGGAVAASVANRILLLSPRLLLRGYRWRDALGREYLRYLQVRLAGAREPVWLREGVARFGEALWRGAGPASLTDLDRGLLARALREGGLVSFAAMSPSFAHLSAPGAVRLALAQCALAVGWMVETWGDDGLRRLVAELARPGDPPGIDEALRASLGVDLAQFEERWRGWLATRGFRETPGAVVPRLRLAGEGTGEAWDLADWQGEGARNHLRLGDLLRERGKLRAALLEYGRGIALAPSSPYAHLKAARAERELGRPERAAAAAGEAVRLLPEYPAAQQELAAALAALGRHAEAASALEAAIEVNPFDPYAWRDLAAALRASGRNEDSRRALRTALELARGDEELLRMMTTDGPGGRGRRE